MIGPDKHALPISEQCELLSVPRSSYYYTAGGESEENQSLMRRIDELHTEKPTWGSRMIRDRLRFEGHPVNRKRVQRLMAIMHIQVLYPKRNLSRRNHEHAVYPYLLKGLVIDRPNQVWSADITYIRLHHGWVYLVAVLDWYSRAVLSYRISNTCDRFFCIEALEEALRRYGSPEIFNTDQGATFTSPDFTSVLLNAGVRISMDGAGRALDNVITERYWRTLKVDEVYLKDYESLPDARTQIGAFIEQYNTFRPHSACGGVPPMVLYSSRCEEKIPA
jgi:putative transposase